MTRQSDGSCNSPTSTIDLESNTHRSFEGRQLRDFLRLRKRRRFRKRARSLLHLVVCRLLPILALILGIAFCLIGALHRLHLILSCGCVLLICSFGLILQSCFWSRSQPNKFTVNEIIRGDHIETAGSSLKSHESDERASNEGRKVDESKAEEDGEVEEPNQGNERRQRPSAGLLEVRRLSLAMTRVASELRYAANQRTAGMGPASFARGLSLGGHPTAIAPMDYDRGAINWYGNFSSSELSHMRRLSQWQNFV